MVSLIKKQVNGRVYWYLCEAKRVNGKPRIVWQKYLGTANKIKEYFENGLAPQQIDALEFGNITSLLSISDELNFVETVDKIIPKRHQGLSIGNHLLLIIINRIDNPLSKNKLSDWFDNTVLKRRFAVKSSYLSSQDFWNHWKKIDQEQTDLIQEKLLDRIFPLINVDELVFDPTNFTTYIEEHKGNKIPQFGHSKNKIKGLRQVNLSLLVNKKDGVPLWHRTYDGNINDVTEFKEFVKALTKRITSFSKRCKNITLILDKGNNSMNNIKNIDKELHFFVVGSLKPSENQELFEIPLEKFNEEYVNANGEKTFCTETTKDVYAGNKKIIITYDNKLAYNQKIRTDKAIQKALNQLQNIQGRIKDSRKSRDEILIKINSIVGKNYLKNLINYELKETANGIDLTFTENSEVYDQKRKTFGKNILFTDKFCLSAQEIIKLYREKNIVEEQIKNLKDTHVIRFTPMWCWTDNMIKVHAFTCVMALLFLRLLVKKVQDAKINLSQDQILDQLRRIKLTILKMPNSDRLLTKITRLNDTQRALVNLLNLRKYE
jgi:transposase